MSLPGGGRCTGVTGSASSSCSTNARSPQRSSGAASSASPSSPGPSPSAWPKGRARRKRCGVPKAARYRTRHELALEMLGETGPLLPHAWVTGDDEMGRSSRFRAELRRLNEPYLLAVPSNTTVRDLEGAVPEYGGRGPHPKRAFEQVRAWSRALPAGGGRRIQAGDGERGPQFVELVATRGVAKTDRGRIGPEELLVV